MKRIRLAGLILVLYMLLLGVTAKAAESYVFLQTGRKAVVGEKFSCAVSLKEGDSVTYRVRPKAMGTMKGNFFVPKKSGKAVIRAAVTTADGEEVILKKRVTVTSVKKVANQNGLDKALANEDLTGITIKTNAERDFVIPEGSYAPVLTVNAPEASVTSNGTFAPGTTPSVVLEAVGTYEESGNNYLKLSAGTVIVPEDRTLAGMVCEDNTEPVTVRVLGVLGTLVVKGEGQVTLDLGETGQILMEVVCEAEDGKLAIVGTAKQAGGIFPPLIPVILRARTDLVTEVPAEITCQAEGCTVYLRKGAGESFIAAEQEELVPEITEE